MDLTTRYLGLQLAHPFMPGASPLANGPSALTGVRDGFVRWADEHGFTPLREMRGAASFERSPRPHDYERANYVDFMKAANRPAPLVN